MKFSVAMPALCLCSLALAQSSPSYRLEESALNAGGHPHDTLVLHSASYRVSLDAVGETLTAPALRSASRSMELGLARGHPPPQEVRQLVALGDKRTLAWAAERSVGAYEIYGGDVRSLPGGYGACRLADVPVEHAALEEEPAAGQAYFYLVTARNTLFEEGTKGQDSAGAGRSNPAACP